MRIISTHPCIQCKQAKEVILVAATHLVKAFITVIAVFLEHNFLAAESALENLWAWDASVCIGGCIKYGQQPVRPTRVSLTQTLIAFVRVSYDISSERLWYIPRRDLRSPTAYRARPNSGRASRFQTASPPEYKAGMQSLFV